MRVVGVVAEYNPFHRGHVKQLQDIRAAHQGKTAIVVILSSYFTQRGIPSLLSPRQRAEIALEAGADLVLLLPQIFSSADAEGFARGAMNILVSSGIVHMLCFGSEISDLTLHEACASLIAPESEELKELTSSILPTVGSPHIARREALLQLGADPKCLTCLDYSNSRLGVEYLAGLKQLSPSRHPLKVMLTRRTGHNENDLSLTGKQASASAIRHLLATAANNRNMFRIHHWNQELCKLLPSQIPPQTLSQLLRNSAETALPLDNLYLKDAVMRLLTIGEPSVLSQYRYLGSGLAERLLSRFSSVDLRVGLPAPEELSSRNFTSARIRRALLSLLLEIREDDYNSLSFVPAFIHPLGFTADGKYLLKKMRSNATLPVLTTLTGLPGQADEKLRYQVRLERNAGFLWHSLLEAKEMHYLLPPVQVKRKA